MRTYRGIIFLVPILLLFVTLGSSYAQYKEYNNELSIIVDNEKEIQSLIDSNMYNEAINRLRNPSFQVEKQKRNAMLFDALLKDDQTNEAYAFLQNQDSEFQKDRIIQILEAYLAKGDSKKVVEIHESLAEAIVEDIKVNINPYIADALTKIQQKEIDYFPVTDWNEDICLMYSKEGYFLVDSNGITLTNNYEEVAVDERGYLFGKQNNYWIFDFNGKYIGMARQNEFQDSKIIDYKKGDSLLHFNAEEDLANSLHSQIIKFESHGLIGYSFKDIEIIEPIYDQGTSVSSKGVAYIIFEGKSFMMRFLALR